MITEGSEPTTRFGRLAVAALAGTAAYFVYGFLVNGLLLRDAYRPYSSVYRPTEAVMALFPLGIAGIFVAILVLAVLLARAGGSGAGADARLGLLAGVFVACTHVLDNYVTLNIGGALAMEIAAASVVQWMLVAVVVGRVCGAGSRA